MAINEKSRNLHQSSRLTRDLADKVRAFGLAQRFRIVQQCQPHPSEPFPPVHIGT